MFKTFLSKVRTFYYLCGIILRNILYYIYRRISKIVGYFYFKYFFNADDTATNIVWKYTKPNYMTNPNLFFTFQRKRFPNEFWEYKVVVDCDGIYKITCFRRHK